MESSFKVFSGDVDAAINIMKEVTTWGRSAGLKVWKDDILQERN